MKQVSYHPILYVFRTPTQFILTSRICLWGMKLDFIHIVKCLMAQNNIRSDHERSDKFSRPPANHPQSKGCIIGHSADCKALWNARKTIQVGARIWNIGGQVLRWKLFIWNKSIRPVVYSRLYMIGKSCLGYTVHTDSIFGIINTTQKWVENDKKVKIRQQLEQC